MDNKSTIENLDNLNSNGYLLSTIYLTVLSLMSALAWTRQFFSKDANPFILQLLSFQVEDAPWMPLDAPPSEPLVGSHHFGDLTLGLGYGKTANPYLLDYPAQIPPLGILEYRLIGFFGYQIALYLLIFLILVPIVIISWKLLSNLEKPLRVIYINLFIFLTIGMITNYDRGALYLTTVGASMMALEYTKQKKYVPAFLIFLLVISLKPQYVILLLLPFFRRKYLFAISTLFATIVVNLILFQGFAGGWKESINGYLTATKRYSGQNSDYSWVVFEGNSIVGGIHKALRIFFSPEKLSEIEPALLQFSALICIIYLFLSLPLIVSKGVPSWFSLSFLFAATMMVVPGSRYYTLAWASAAAIYFCTGDNKPWVEETKSKSHLYLPRKFLPIARMAVIFMIIGSLTPWMIRIRFQGDYQAPMTYFVPQWTIMISTVVCLLLIRKTKLK